MIISYVAALPQLNVSSQTVHAKTRMLKARWTAEAAQDMLNFKIEEDVEKNIKRSLDEMFMKKANTDEIDFEIVINRLKAEFPDNKAKKEEILPFLSEYQGLMTNSDDIYTILVEAGVIIEEEYEWGKCPI